MEKGREREERKKILKYCSIFCAPLLRDVKLSNLKTLSLAGFEPKYLISAGF